MQIISNEWFQTIGVPLILASIAQLLFLLGKRATKITVNDFASLPYSLGASSLGINAALALSKPGDVSLFYSWSFLLVLAMAAIAIVQRFARISPWLVNPIAAALGIFFMAATFSIWR